MISSAEYLLMHWAVLVLDRQAILALPALRGVSLDVGVSVHFLPLVYPHVLLGPREHHDRGKTVAI